MQNRKEIIYIEVTPGELQTLISSQIERGLSDARQDIKSLQELLTHSSPSLTREQAAIYCDRSVSWIDQRRQADNLPSITVGGHPRFLRSDLDHLLTGGTFHKNGKQKTTASV